MGCTPATFYAVVHGNRYNILVPTWPTECLMLFGQGATTQDWGSGPELLS